MAANDVSGGVHITLLKNGDSLNATLNSTAPLYQTFKKGTDDYNPNWETMSDDERPVIYPRIYSAMQGAVLTPANLSWKYNGVDMTFDSSGVATFPEGCEGRIKEIDYNSAKALKMIDNIASDLNNDSDTITFTGSVTTGGQTLQVTAEITILVEEANSNLYRLFLNTADDVIDGSEEYIQVVASLFNTGVGVTSGVQFEFLDLQGNVLKAKNSSDTLNVTKEMVNGELVVVCKAYVDNAVVAQEQRQVWDLTDPYVISCNRGSNTSQSEFEDIVYAFSLVNMRTGQVVPDKVFDFKVYKDADNSDITSQFTTKTDTSITIPGAKIGEHKGFYINASTTIG
jgi:hypothetical protein